MTLQEFIKKYSSEKCDDPIQNLFDSFERWLKDNPTVTPSVPKQYGYKDVLDILFANGITER